MKKNILSLITAFTLSITVCNLSISSDAVERKEHNINMIVLFNNNEINTDIEEIILESGGQVVKEMPDIGGIEVECNTEIIPELSQQSSIEAVSPNHIIKIEKNKEVDFNNYYKVKGNNYYENISSGYYEDNGSSYYEDKGNSYYDDNSSGYYDGNDFIDDKNNSTACEEEDIFDGNLYEKYQWDIKRVTNNGESFNIEPGNHNVIIGVIDSGVDTDHPDLKDNFMGGKNFVPKYFQGNKSESGSISDIEDRFGHGTKVTGQIAANGRTKGIAPNIGFKSYRVFDENGQTTASICADAIIAAINDGVKVINLSFGSFYLDGECKWVDDDTGEEYNLGDDMADYSLLERAIKYAVDNGVIVITAAGNESLDCSDNEKLTEYFNDLYKDDGFSYSGIMYEAPGCLDGVINVSASNKNDQIASYSNYGQNFIDITAPSGDIMDSFNIKNMCLTTSVNNEYSFTTGTSFSAPKVSAAAALLISHNKNLKPDEVVQKLYDSADKLNDSKYYGAGILNIYNALN